MGVPSERKTLGSPRPSGALPGRGNRWLLPLRPHRPPTYRDLLALTAYVARQSRGLPIESAIDERTKPFLDAGRATFHRRQGQLNLACNQCHGDNWGRRLAGNVVPQAHPTGYPSTVWSGRASARSSAVGTERQEPPVAASR